MGAGTAEWFSSGILAYFWLGWLYHIPPTQAYRQARNAYEKGLAFKPTNKIALSNLGIVYEHFKEYETARGYHEQALAIARETGDRGREERALGDLGVVYISLAEYETAINYLEQILPILEEIQSSYAEEMQQLLEEAKREAGGG